MLVRAARVISNILHPYLAFSLVVIVIAYQQSPSLLVWGKWVAIALAPAYIIPFIYVRIRFYMLAHNTGAQVNLRSFFREQPYEMAILACMLGIPGATIVYFLDYPLVITATMLGLSAAAAVTALVNLRYRASFHIALFTSLVTPLGIVFGLPAFTIVLFLLLLGASRYILAKHSILQLVTGLAIGLTASAPIFYGFNLI